MLEKAGSNFIANCDCCSNYFDTEEEEWQAAIDKMKAKGWRVHKTSGEWMHECDECQDGSKDFESV